MRNGLASLYCILSIAFLTATLAFAQVKSASDSEMVLFRASVVNKDGKILENLKKEQFTINDEGVEQEISYFSDKEEPASVVILLDLSESILPRMQNLNLRSALRFIRESNSQNEYSIIGFNKEVKELVDWKDKGDQIVEKLNQFSGEKNLFGNTRFYDAILTAFEKFNTGAHKKRILLILSDGTDNESEESFGKVIKALKRNDVAIYSIAVFSGDSSSIMDMRAQAVFDEMAAISGGKTFFPMNKVEGEEVIERIVAVVKRQYVIGYIPKESTKKKDWHSVKVKVSMVDEKGKKRSLPANTRKGYFVQEEK